MKIALTIGILFSFVGIAVFGFTAMSHESDHGYGCIATTAQGINCSNENRAINLVSFHANSFKGFSTALVGQSVAVLLFSLFLLAMGIWISFTHRLAPQSNISTRQRHRSRSFVPPFKTEFIHWLALHENSPSTL
ncbi:MAG TPA: hypothetical protein VJC20_00970 [Candidatus Paceibacterota bacterium]